MSPDTVAKVPGLIVSFNPTNGERLREYEPHTHHAVESKLQLALESFRDYRKTPFALRSQMMTRLAEILENEKEAFGHMMTLEMGKPLRAAIQEAENALSLAAIMPKTRKNSLPMKKRKPIPQRALSVTSLSRERQAIPR